jgi:hypothetical protein
MLTALTALGLLSLIVLGAYQRRNEPDTPYTTDDTHAEINPYR